MHLMQFADSALPVGGFSFSNTLESAIEMGVVCDEASLAEFTRQIVRQAATTDAIAALNAYRATGDSDYSTIIRCDKTLNARKVNTEQRLMSLRIGRKLAELFAEITDNDLLRRLCGDIASAHIPGTYAVTQGVVFAICEIGERELFAAICYGAASMVLNAALRTMRITHRHTQRIIFALADEVGMMYEEVAGLDICQMHAFYPQIDVLAAIHEKGTKRLFMN